MIHKTLILTPLFSILFLTACSQKTTYTRTISIENNVTTYTEGDFEINQVATELSQSLALPLKDRSFYQNDNRTLGEITLLKLNTTLCIILNGKIFQRGEDKPRESVTYILEDITNILKKYPHLIVQVTGHSDKETESNDLDLSDNRAISIAEILYSLEARNETYAKGCGDRKPLFTSFQSGERVSNARIEIYLYANKERMLDHCR